ncbi:hypothetical protein NUV25_18935 [Burkholderia pseudomultivorans]|uniref:hypothetical protein n=1 Tax=Burkholderia pseudomultivorans TaxID=1207504 RepID=UPI0028757E87|nr:hypothetical protein [Burkholderia pseudomultivorans]MDS0859786.1 hypothetical protein [Burkholderia pseudomultivorans]
MISSSVPIDQNGGASSVVAIHDSICQRSHGARQRRARTDGIARPRPAPRRRPSAAPACAAVRIPASQRRSIVAIDIVSP